MQLKTVALLSNAALLSDATLLISDNVEYDNKNLKIDSKKEKIMHVPLMLLHQTISMPMLVLTTSSLSVIFKLLHPYSSIFPNLLQKMINIGNMEFITPSKPKSTQR